MLQLVNLGWQCLACCSAEAQICKGGTLCYLVHVQAASATMFTTHIMNVLSFA